MTTHYYCSLGRTLNPKNKLHHAVQEYLKTIHGTLVPVAEQQKIKEIILANIARLNIQNARCAPLQVAFVDEYTEADSFALVGFEEQYFYLLPATLKVLHQD